MSIVKKHKGNDVPEGATHYDPAHGFYKYNVARLMYFDARDGWVGSRIKGAYEIQNIIELPQEPEQYMPKVGEECEYVIHDATHWFKCEIFDIGQVGVYMYCHHFSEDGYKYQWVRKSSVKFRPIKKDREQFMEKVADAICDASIEQLDEKSNVKRIAGIIFDAGLAKEVAK